MGSTQDFLPVNRVSIHSDRPLALLKGEELGNPEVFSSKQRLFGASQSAYDQRESDVEDTATLTASSWSWPSQQPDFYTPQLEEAIHTTEDFLTTFARSRNFFQTLSIPFGKSFSREAAQDLRYQWRQGDFSDLPLIQIRTAVELNGALSAFSKETNTVYLSRDYLEQNRSNPEAIAGILLEEVGHFVDAAINRFDAPGDEGAIFSALLQGSSLDPTALQTLKTEDDRATLSIDGQTIQVELAAGDPVNGLRAEYYDNADLTNLKLTRTDATVNFSWGTGSPNSAIAPDTFSARWTGQVQPTTSGTYTFYTQSDDGIRLWVNGTQLINNWTNHSVTENQGTITLTAGQKYDIRLEYYENGGGAVARLLWAGPSVSKQIIPQSRLFSVAPGDTTPPTASATATNVTTPGGTTYSFTVTYTDNIAVNAATLDGNDVRLTGPNGFNQLASLVSVNTSGNGTPRTATYRVPAPGGTWNAADNGTYTLALQANQVSDTSGNFIAARTLGSFSASLANPDAIAPTASATAANVTTAGGTVYQFTVTYSDNTAMNIASLGSGDISVTGPNNFSQPAALVSVNNSTNGTPRTATYQITAPGSSWDTADNGTYTLALQPNQVSDTSGNFIPASSLGTFLVNLAPLITDENIVFPADAGVLNVKTFGAKGDGVTDDTAAIQAALNAYPNGKRIIYLPNGTYLVSNTLTWPAGDPGTGDDYKNTILQGQSQQGAVIKLKNNAAGYTNANSPKSVIFTGPAPAQRFGNSIRNLTVDTGTGNAGAIGIQFNASNQGSLRQVTIRSGDGFGVNGLDMNFVDEIGPLLVKDVTVNGFQYGIRTGFTVNSQTLENITLQNQKVYGLYNTGQALNIRGLTSNNAVTGLYNAGGRVTIIDSTFNGTGAASSQPAIQSDYPLDLVVRNITTSGYQSAILNNDTPLAGPNISEYISGPVLSLFSSPNKTLNLPIKETPDVPWDDPITTPWANVVSYGAIPDDGLDDTAAIQAAIDSGKTTVYLPVGNYDLKGTVLVRNNVRRILGTEAYVAVPDTVSTGFKVIDGTSPVVVIERFQSAYNYTTTAVVENASSRTLVLRDASLNARFTGSGDVFIENVASDQLVINGQNVWARQLNIENLGTKLINNGGNLWILGLKTERGGTLIDTRAGGKTEVLGGLAYTTTAGPNGTQNYPLFINNESSVSVTLGEVNFGAPTYTTYFREIRGGVTRNLSHNSLQNYISLGKHIPLYVGY